MAEGFQLEDMGETLLSKAMRTSAATPFEGEIPRPGVNPNCDLTEPPLSVLARHLIRARCAQAPERWDWGSTSSAPGRDDSLPGAGLWSSGLLGCAGKGGARGKLTAKGASWARTRRSAGCAVVLRAAAR
jgi:hypothetical protein